jgi:putative transport protein
MEWLANVFTKYPEMAVYLAIGIGYVIGQVKFRGVGLGVVTGSLLGGILIGNFFHVPVSDQAKAMLFLLFLFGIGYSVGPSFFSNLKGEGWRWAVLGAFVPIIGLVTAYAVASFLKLDPGFSAGLLSGSLTESPAIGTASEAIRGLSVSEEQKLQWIGHVAVADAICYIFGTLGVILMCGTIGPKLLRVDLKSESKKVEDKLGIRRTKLGVSSAWQPVSYRAYKIRPDGRVVGKTVAEVEKSVPNSRLFVERIRRDDELFWAAPTTILEAGDTVAVLGRTEALIDLVTSSSLEASDPELLEIPVASYGLYVTNKAVAGKTLGEIVNSVEEVRGVFLRGIKRGGESIPFGSGTIVQRGDTLQVTGSEAAVERLAPLIGRVISPTEDSDFVVMGIAIFLGVLVGAILVIPIGSMRIALGTSVGTLLAGVLVGWLRSLKPWFGQMPDAAISFMKSIGLAAFVAMVGLKAGPIFINAVKEYGYILFLGGIVVTMLPLITGLFFGRYLLKLSPVLLLGGIAGAQTMIAGVAAVQEKSDSSVATLGYSYTVAVAHILLTTWGTIIVSLMT